MKKLLVLVLTLAVVCGLLFAFNVNAAEGTTTNIASEATVTTPTTSWWITQNLGRLVDGDEGTGMHSSCHDRDTTVNFAFETERYITKIVMKVNGTATTTAQNKTDLNANTNYKITYGDTSVTLNALDKTELVLEVNTSISGFKIEFYSGWSGDNALIREVEVYEYIPPVVEAATGNNIEDEATIEITDGNDYIIGGAEYLRDNDPSTGLSAGNAASWINYHFLYAKARGITKVKVVVNSTGTMYKVDSADGTYVHETMSTLPNIYLRLYDAKGVVYKLENQSTANAVEVTKDGKTYMEYTFDLGGAVYEDIVKVEIATLHNKDTKLGVWEVEIIDFQCQKDEDHKYIDATCVTPATCKFCGVTTGTVSDDHTLLPANCGKPIHCQFCDYTEGTVTGDPHVWANASYTAPKTCKVCGTTEGGVWVDSDLPAFVRGPENDMVTYDDIVGEVELVAGSNGAGIPEYVLDGITTNAAQYWGGPTNTQIKITLKNEWEITDAKVYLFANWASLKVGFYAADGTLLGEKGIGGLQANYDWFNGKVQENPTYTDYNGALSKITYGDADKAVKYIIITNTGDKWGWVPGVVEVYFSGRERIPSNCSGHVFEAVYNPAPTCTEDGVLVNTCTECGETEAPVVAPALGHDMGEYTIKVPATCTHAAIVEFACQRCGETIERDANVQDVTDYGDLLNATINGAGSNTTGPMALFDNNMNTILQASGGWFVESTIELDMYYYLSSVTVWVGNGGNEAKVTFYYWNDETGDWATTGSMPTPVVAGAENKYTYYFDPVYSNKVRVRVDGLNSHYGVAYEAEVGGSIIPNTAAVGHNWVVSGDTVAPTCVNHGYTPYTCADCGETTNASFVVPTGIHTCSMTFNEEGKNLCAVCGNTYAANKVTHGEWADATCQAPKTCTVCGVTEGNKLAHTEIAIPEVPATCTTEGATAGVKCEVCDEIITAPETVDAFGHDYVANVTEPTCTDDGYTTYVCANCGDEYEDEDSYVDAIGHSWATDVVEPTCTEQGYTMNTCENCGEESKSDFVDAIGHNIAFWLEDYDTADATCVAEGYEIGTCMNCEQTVEVVLPINPENHINKTFNEAWTIGACDDCGTVIFSFWGIKCADYALFADIYGTNIDIYDEEYTVYVTYVFEISSVADGVYTITITETYAEEDIFALVGATATISEDGLVAGDYTFATASDEPTESEFAFMNGTYTSADGSIIFVVEEGFVDIYENDTYLGFYAIAWTDEFDIIVASDDAALATWSADEQAWAYGETYVYAANNDDTPDEYPELVPGENTITTEGGNVTYVVTVPGEYTLNFGEGTVVYLVTGPYEATPIESGYTFTVNEGDTVTFDIGREDVQAGEVTVVLVKAEDEEPEDVIDNAAVNGEYYMGTDLVVFDNGKLYAMGGEFNYTYNVTTGMIETDAGIFFQVIDGVIYYRGATPLHQHTDDGYIAVENEDGSTSYICNYCGYVAYTINNAAINGEYYMGTDLVVFENGKLTAMGGEFNYTYNVTTGMIDTDAGIFFQVIDGVIYYRGATPLHQHTDDGYVADEQADGSVNYICNYCGYVAYTINNAAVNGEYYMGFDLVVFENGKLTAMGSEFNYTYNVTTGMIDTDAAGINFKVIDGVIYFKGATPLHQHNENTLSYETTDATCDKDGVTVTICQFCGPISEETITAKGHVEVEIPAVLPRPSTNHEGYTAGTECTVCGNVVVAPVKVVAGTAADAKFKINSAGLALGEDVSMNYTATLVAGGKKDEMYMVFVIEGEEFIVTESKAATTAGRYTFNFAGLKSYQFAENISAYVYAIENGNYVVNSQDYSVYQYVSAQLKKTTISNNLRTLLSTVLAFGEASQVKVGTKYNDRLVVSVKATTDGLNLTTPAFEGIDESYKSHQSLTGDRTQGYDWKSGTLSIGSSIFIQLKFTADSTENLMLNFEVDGRSFQVDASELTKGTDGRYTVLFQVKVLENDKPVTCTFIKDGEQVGSTLTYSVYRYLCANYNTSDTKAGNLMKAIYTYTEASKAYSANPNK